jgi:hypothetical protein
MISRNSKFINGAFNIYSAFALDIMTSLLEKVIRCHHGHQTTEFSAGLMAMLLWKFEYELND